MVRGPAGQPDTPGQSADVTSTEETEGGERDRQEDKET